MAANYPVGELIETSIGGGWGADELEDDSSPVAVIRGTDIPRLSRGDFSSVPRRFESNRKIRTRLLEVGDIVLEVAGGSAARGQYTGRTLLVTTEILEILGPAICASFCKRLVLRKDLIDPLYFFYFMQDLYKSGRVADYDSQSTGISNFQFAAFMTNEMLELPPREIQAALSTPLELVDQKILSNRGLANTLESIAQTLFRSWFVDFDPVRAKMAGEKPAGMDDATAALFPDSMEESELGQIPAGWTSGSLGDLIEIHDSKRIPLSSAQRKARKGIYPYYGATGVLDYVDSALFSGPHVLVGEDGTVITDRGTPVIQYVWGDFWVNNHAHVLTGKGHISTQYLKLFLQTVDVSNYITGAVQQKLNQGNLRSIPAVVPQPPLTEIFDRFVSSIFLELQSLDEESHSLVAIRDALLSRLISGELEVPEDLLVS